MDDDLTPVYEALKKADASGNSADAKKLADYIRSHPAKPVDVNAIPSEPGHATQPTTPQPKPPVGSAMGAAGEVGLSMIFAPFAQAVGTVKSIGNQILGGKLGDPKATQEAAQEADKFAEEYTYTPKTQAGKNLAQAISDVAEPLKGAHLEALGPVAGELQMAPEASQAAKVATASKIAKIEERTKEMLAAAKSQGKTPEMIGVGAAETEAARIREERAQSHPVPIKLTEGAKTREYNQQAKEHALETDKDPEIHKPIRQRAAENNEALLANFDAYMDQTGAQSSGLIATGRVVTDAVAKKYAAQKAKVTAAYEKARQAGEMEELVPTDSIVHYLNENRPAAINAGVLSAAEQKLVKLGGAALDKDGNLVPGKMSINDVEEVRKFVSKTAGKDPTNMHFGDELKTAIDASTEGKGGELYKQARALHRQTAQEFKNTGVVAKLLRDKPGTTDRAVALEDVFKHSVMSSSNEDLRALRRTLQTQGEDGKQAWRELQGETVRQIKESVTANASLDERGNPIVSPAKFKRVVDELDKDEKLEILFGKKGAQQLRDLRDTAMDVSTKVPGSVNFSGTGSYLMRALDAMHLLHIPYAGKVAAAVAERSIKNEKKAAVAHALGETPKQKLLKDHQDSNPVAPRKMTGTDE